MALTAEEQKFYDFARRALPKFLFAKVRPEEVMGAFAKIFGAAKTAISGYFDQALIGQATSSGANYLNQHAIDRGTYKQAGETDAALRARLRNVEDAITRPALLAAAAGIVSADGVVGLYAAPRLYQQSNTTFTPTAPNKLEKTSGTDGLWNAYAHAATYDLGDNEFDSSRQFLTGSGYLEFTVDQANKAMWIGMAHDNGFDPFDSYPEVQYAFEMTAAGVLNCIWHNNTRFVSTHAATDVLRITFDTVADTVVWSKNGTPLYTETDAGLDGVLFGGDALPCTFSAWFKGLNGSISNIRIYDQTVTNVFMVELRRDKAFFGTNTADAGTGGTFAGTAPNMSYTPTVPFASPPFRVPEEELNHKLVISGAASAGNDGTFDITGMNGNACEFQNASGVAEADATVTWSVSRHDRDGNTLTGFAKSFMSRGYRMGRIGPAQPTDPLGFERVDQPPVIIIILPFDTTAATQASVEEQLRQKKGAGLIARVERRTSL
jgi:hypothetical protein